MWEKSGHVFTQNLNGYVSTAVADEECLLEFLFSGRVIYGLTIAAFTWTHYITHEKFTGFFFFIFVSYLVNEVKLVLKRVGLNTLGKCISPRNGIMASIIIAE